MSLDTYTEHNPINPTNIEEIEVTPQTELEAQQEWNMELCAKIALAKNQLKYCIEITEQGTNTLLLNNLLKIKL